MDFKPGKDLLSLVENGEAEAVVYLSLLLLHAGEDPEVDEILIEAGPVGALAEEFFSRKFNVRPGEKTLNKLQAAVLILMSDSFEADRKNFSTLCLGLKGFLPADEVLSEFLYTDLLECVYNARMIRSEIEFSEDVVAFILAKKMEAGYDPSQVDPDSIDGSLQEEFKDKVIKELIRVGFDANQVVRTFSDL
jgi:hypothetical protein